MDKEELTIAFWISILSVISIGGIAAWVKLIRDYNY